MISYEKLAGVILIILSYAWAIYWWDWKIAIGIAIASGGLALIKAEK